MKRLGEIFQGRKKSECKDGDMEPNLAGVHRRKRRLRWLVLTGRKGDEGSAGKAR